MSLTDAPTPIGTVITVPPAETGTRESNGIATASLVCGIVGATIALIPILGIFGLATGLVALVLGLIARRRAVKRGRATAGAILGVVAVGLGVLGLVIVNNAVNDLGDDLDRLADTPTVFVDTVDEARSECATSPTGFVMAYTDGGDYTINCETGEATLGAYEFGD